MARPYDLVVYGGSGFTGRLAAEYLARRYTAGGSDSSSETVRWAIAGRDRAKLDAVVQSIERKHPHAKGKIDVLVGSDPASLETLASKTNALVSFAGPFAKVGMPVVDACVKCGTDYCDITGEPPFIRDVVDKHDAAARAAGTCVVNCVGYDSAPWDLGAWAVSEWFASRGDVCEMARGHLGSAKGGVSGGTIASAIGLVASTPWKTLAAMASPHFLSDAPPSDPNVLAKWKIQSGVAYDRDLGRWTMPSVMAGINAKVVARSSAIARSPNGPYSPSFAYDESDLCSGFLAPRSGRRRSPCSAARSCSPPRDGCCRRPSCPRRARVRANDSARPGSRTRTWWARGGTRRRLRRWRTRSLRARIRGIRVRRHSRWRRRFVSRCRRSGRRRRGAPEGGDA